jgi:hypothetical protein
MRSTPETLAWIRGQAASGSTAWYMLCLSLARQGRGLDGKYSSAYTAWVGSKRKHPLTTGADWSKVPTGAPIFYKGSGQYGHVTTYAGFRDGAPLCWTNDVAGRGRVSAVHPLWFVSHWSQPILGWCNDLNGVDLNLPIPGGSKPTVTAGVSVKAMVAAARNDPKRPQGGATPGSADDVRKVENGLVKVGMLDKRYVDGSFGTKSIDAYAKWQKSLGFKGKAADGIPGRVSLQRLGDKAGFKVVA